MSETQVPPEAGTADISSMISFLRSGGDSGQLMSDPRVIAQAMANLRENAAKVPLDTKIEHLKSMIVAGHLEMFGLVKDSREYDATMHFLDHVTEQSGAKEDLAWINEMYAKMDAMTAYWLAVKNDHVPG